MHAFIKHKKVIIEQKSAYPEGRRVGNVSNLADFIWSDFQNKSHHRKPKFDHLDQRHFLTQMKCRDIGYHCTLRESTAQPGKKKTLLKKEGRFLRLVGLVLLHTHHL